MCPSEGACAQLKALESRNLLLHVGGSSDEDLPVWNTPPNCATPKNPTRSRRCDSFALIGGSKSPDRISIKRNGFCEEAERAGNSCRPGGTEHRNGSQPRSDRTRNAAR